MKRGLKTLFTGVFGNRFGARLLRPLWRGRSAVFLLHRLAEPSHSTESSTVEEITANLKVLRRAGAQFVSLSYLFDLAVRGLEPEPGCVAFTIDDGYADQGVMAEAAFLKNGCPVTVFLITGLVDGQLWPWDDHVTYSIQHSTRPVVVFEPTGETLKVTTPEQRSRAAATVRNYCKEHPWADAAQALESLYTATGCRPPQAPPAAYRALTWTEARRLEAAGVEFAPHSITHRITSRLSAEEVREEISGSWKRLQQELAHPVPIYAWPTGRAADFSERDMEIAAAVGLSGAVAATNDYARFHNRGLDPINLFSVGRFAMSVSTDDVVQYGTALERFKQLVRLNP
jgi:peptidoglycan/xylan/chitin deacetylase (PgdA/CDA1 family)